MRKSKKQDKFKALSIAALAGTIAVLSSQCTAAAQDIDINSWYELSQNAQNLNNKYVLQDGVNASGHINVGHWDDANKGSWNLDGNNVELSGNYRRSGFSIENNIDSFVFENLNVKEVKDGNGGLIWNGGTGGVLKNSIISSSGGINGGVIYNQGTFNSITGNKFSNNFVDNGNGGVIYNDGTIGTISSVFDSNGAYSCNSGGGAIYNNNYIDNIENSEFTANMIRGSAKNGAAIYNSENALINTIRNSNFTDNGKLTENSNYVSGGGAIYNNGTIGKIDDKASGIIGGSFVGNSAQFGGGAIFNEGSIYNISGVTFDSNYSGDEGGGAIKNKNFIASINNSIFLNNKSDTALGTVLDGKGAAIYNTSGATINEVKSSQFYSNVSNDFGGALSNFGLIDVIEGATFGDKGKGNQGASAGAINNQDGGKINKITNSKFLYNKAIETSDYIQGFGGAIVNRSQDGNNKSEIGVIDNVVFSNNEANGLKEEYRGSSGHVYGGAIYNNLGNIGAIRNSSFESNKALAGFGTAENGYQGNGGGGAITNIEGSIGSISNVTFNKNFASGNIVTGGAIYNNGTIGDKDSADNTDSGIINSTFVGNYAEASENGTAQGGAIWTNNDINIIADNGTSIFKGNYTQVGTEKDDNAIYSDNDAAINFEIKHNGRIDMYDNIRGLGNYPVNITGDGTGVFGMYNDMYGANLSVGNTTLTTVNNMIHVYDVNSFTLTGNTNMIADVDLANKSMDRFTASSYGEHSGNLSVIGMNLLSDAEKDKTEIFFAQTGLKDNVINGTGELPDKNQIAYTPIYKYTVNYDKREDGGYFVFNRGGLNGGGSDGYNPAVLASPVTAQAGAQAAMNETFKYVFEHADAFTKIPSMERLSIIKNNQYAISTDFNNNLGSLAPEFNNHAGWFRPYVTFENMHLKNGPKVNAITYGSLAGFDSNFQELRKGWTGLTTGYIGYNGSQLHYSGVDTTMNGGILGLTQTFYKGNFWTALTATAGASVGQTTTMYGKEDFTSLMAGVGSKTGYNFEFKEGKYIIQPIMFMSYTFVNTFDYTNAAGVRINNNPAHTIQLNPSVRFIANTKNNWQPYASVGMVWNVMNSSNVTANNVKLPEMSIKPYVEYGIGIQKRFNDKYTAFGQAMLRNGGRNGIAITGGFRWDLGKGVNENDKVQGVNKNRVGHSELDSESINANEMDRLRIKHGVTLGCHPEQREGSLTLRKVVKQMTPSQKTALIKQNTTTRTTASAILKQL